MTVRLLYDASPQHGMGHLRRMTALAAALRETGIHTDLSPIGSEMATGDHLFIDSYAIRADDRSRFVAPWIGAIDDLERSLAVDVLVDPAGRSGNSHHWILAGFDFALLDPDITDVPTQPARDHAKSVVVAAGAADARSKARDVARAIVERDPSLDVAVVVSRVQGEANSVREIVTDGGLVDVLASADLVVTAAGVTMLESLALGRPTIAFVTAENQRRGMDAAAAVGAIVGCAIDDAPEHAIALLADAERRAVLAIAGARLVDGRGARRVASAIADATA